MSAWWDQSHAIQRLRLEHSITNPRAFIHITGITDGGPPIDVEAYRARRRMFSRYTLGAREADIDRRRRG